MVKCSGKDRIRIESPPAVEVQQDYICQYRLSMGLPRFSGIINFSFFCKIFAENGLRESSVGQTAVLDVSESRNSGNKD